MICVFMKRKPLPSRLRPALLIRPPVLPIHKYDHLPALRGRESGPNYTRRPSLSHNAFQVHSIQLLLQYKENAIYIKIKSDQSHMEGLK